MSQFVITGPTRLSGEFEVCGSKNAVLPIMAACLLIKGPVVLHNVPRITDVEAMADILRHLGSQVQWQGADLVIDATQAAPAAIDQRFSGKLRASILLVGPMLARFGEVELAYPGGDIIGRRPIDSHIDSMRGLGCEISVDGDRLAGKGRPRGGDITIEALSVTGTENAIIAAVVGEGKTRIRLAAVEPHVIALCDFLEAAGARIGGVNSHDLAIEAVPSLRPGETAIIPDYVEAGTMAIAAAATRSSLRIKNFWQQHNECLLWALKKIGVHYSFDSLTSLTVYPSAALRALNIRTDIFPGFPSDLQAQLAVLLTQAEGTSEIFETLFEGRLNYFHDLARIGANVHLKDAHTGVITGPTPLRGQAVVSIDIRAGATMVIAALLAEGVTTVDHIEHIDRGYERLDERLRAIGADIQRRD